MSEFINTRDTMTEAEAFDALIADDLEEIKDNVVSKLGSYALYGREKLKRIEMPAVTSILSYVLHSCISLESADFASVTNIGSYVFSGDISLVSVNCPLCTTFGQEVFMGCTMLKEIDLDEATSLGNDCFEYSGLGKLVIPKVTSLGTYIGKGTRMSTVDITKVSNIKANNFNGMSALVELILRNTSLVTLGATSAFTGTPIASGIGYIYVPDDLVDTYKAASNWSTYASQIKPISDYPLPFQNETITDSWAEILAAEEAGTYSTRYSLGDIKYVDVGGTKLPMQIVAFDTDDLAAGGKAKITWISKCLLNKSKMNGTLKSVSGGWAECALREWLRSDLYSTIESTVRNAIKEVTKTYKSVLPSTGTYSVTDTVWIPSSWESNYEGSGPKYTDFFTSKADRIKKAGQAGGSLNWWTRSVLSPDGYGLISSAGDGGSIYVPIQENGIALGFCT